MNRRDTIIVAVLLNSAIIAVLLMMAVTKDIEPKQDVEIHSSAVEIRKTGRLETVVNLDLESPSLEELFAEPTLSSEELFVLEEDLNPLIEVSEDSSSPRDREEKNVKIVEVVVKKGDSLDKIARANGTTVNAIKKLSQLNSERLSIGQLLKVPVGLKNVSISKAGSEPIKEKMASSQDAEYYTIKSGDSPWKVAKQYQVKMEDLLRLNQLDETKARNLKPGDRIRVR